MTIDLPVVPNAGPTEMYYQHLARPVLVQKNLDADDPGYRGETSTERDARRMDERMPPGYKPVPAVELLFDPRIAYEIALGLDKPVAVFEKYHVPHDRAVELISMPAFIATLKKYQEEIAAGGISFRLKAKMQAEDLLTHSYLMATDPEVPFAVRADLIKWTARVAGLEPKEDKGTGGAGGFALNITFSGDKAPTAVIGRTIDNGDDV